MANLLSPLLHLATLTMWHIFHNIKDDINENLNKQPSDVQTKVDSG